MKASIIFSSALFASWASGAAIAKRQNDEAGTRISGSNLPPMEMNEPEAPAQSIDQDQDTNTDTASIIIIDTSAGMMTVTDIIPTISTDSESIEAVVITDSEIVVVITETSTSTSYVESLSSEATSAASALFSVATSASPIETTTFDAAGLESLIGSTIPAPTLTHTDIVLSIPSVFDQIVTPRITEITEVIPAATTTITRIPPNGTPVVLISTVRANFTTVRTYVIEEHAHTTVTQNYTVPYPSTAVYTRQSTTYIPTTIDYTVTDVVTITKVYQSAYKSFDFYYITTKRPVTEVAQGEITGELTVRPVTSIITTTHTTTEEVFPSFYSTTIVENGIPKISTIHLHHHSDDFGIHNGEDRSTHHQLAHTDITDLSVIENLSFTTFIPSVPTPSMPTQAFLFSDLSEEATTISPETKTTSFPILSSPTVFFPPLITPIPFGESFGDINWADLTEIEVTSTWETTQTTTISTDITTVVGVPTHIPAISLFTSVQTFVSIIETVVTLTGVPTTFETLETSLVTFSSIPTPFISITTIVEIPTLSSVTITPTSVPSNTPASLVGSLVSGIGGIISALRTNATISSVDIPSVSVPTMSVSQISIQTVTRSALSTLIHTLQPHHPIPAGAGFIKADTTAQQDQNSGVGSDSGSGSKKSFIGSNNAINRTQPSKFRIRRSRAARVDV